LHWSVAQNDAVANIADLDYYIAASDALSQKQPACTGETSQNTFYAARKCARYFIIIEGAYFSMVKNQFVSFPKDEVLKGLFANSKGFEDILTLSTEVLRAPVDANVTHGEYLIKIRPFVEWMLESIAES
jgi:hypothetical protein